jgi:hypothetical protein
MHLAACALAPEKANKSPGRTNAIFKGRGSVLFSADGPCGGGSDSGSGNSGGGGGGGGSCSGGGGGDGCCWKTGKCNKKREK